MSKRWACEWEEVRHGVIWCQSTAQRNCWRLGAGWLAAARQTHLNLPVACQVEVGMMALCLGHRNNLVEKRHGCRGARSHHTGIQVLAVRWCCLHPAAQPLAAVQTTHARAASNCSCSTNNTHLAQSFWPQTCVKWTCCRLPVTRLVTRSGTAAAAQLVCSVCRCGCVASKGGSTVVADPPDHSGQGGSVDTTSSTCRRVRHSSETHLLQPPKSEQLCPRSSSALGGPSAAAVAMAL